MIEELLPVGGQIGVAHELDANKIFRGSRGANPSETTGEPDSRGEKPYIKIIKVKRNCETVHTDKCCFIHLTRGFF